jgi:hypothetical protein
MTTDVRARNHLGSGWVALLLVLLTGALFVVDLVAPTRVAEGIGYAPVLVLCIWLPGRYTLITVAAVMTGLVIVGSFLGPTSDISFAAEFWNRAVAIAMIWVNYLFLSNKPFLSRALKAADRRRFHGF